MNRRDFIFGISSTSVNATPFVTASAKSEIANLTKVNVISTIEELRKLNTELYDEVWIQGYNKPADGGEGLFYWDANSTEKSDNGTIFKSIKKSRGRWKRQYAPGTVVASWFNDLPSLILYCKKNSPITVHLPKGEWNFKGLQIPNGITFIGVGILWSGGRKHGGFDNGSIILGNPIQEMGPSSSRFVGIVFDGGFTIRKQWTYFENCAFVSGSLVFDQRDASPYYCTVNNCVFRDISNGPCIHLIAQANANRITNCTLIVENGQRGIVAEGYKGAYPTTNLITGCGIERNYRAKQIGSYIYGDFHNLTFLGNYLDQSRPIFIDGGDIVLTQNSRENRIWLPNKFGDVYINRGLANTFYGNPEDSIYIGSNDFDLDKYSCLPDMIIIGGGAKNIRLPPIEKLYGKKVTITCERAAGVTIYPAVNEKINGIESLFLKNGEGYIFFNKHYLNNPVKNWISRLIW